MRASDDKQLRRLTTNRVKEDGPINLLTRRLAAARLPP